MSRAGSVIERPGAADLEHDPVILRGAEILRRGGLVAFPTETVYGLGADATNAAAVEKIYRAKGRPPDNPLIVHVSAVGELGRVASVTDPRLAPLLDRFWPGPLTVVLPAVEPIRTTVCRGLTTVAVRLPDHPIARALIRQAGCPVAAPSANLSGRPSPTTAEHVLADLGGEVDLILDGGPCTVGIESTVLDLSEEIPRILRPGAVTAEAIEDVLLSPVATAQGEASKRSPGTRFLHYRPRAPLVVLGRELGSASISRLLGALSGARLGYIQTRPTEPPELPAGVLIRRRCDLEDLTRHLYADFRSLDAEGVSLLFVEAVDEREAIMDRIVRASAMTVASDEVAADPGVVKQLQDLGVAAGRPAPHPAN